MRPDIANADQVRFDPRVRRWIWLLGIAGLIPFVGHTVVATMMAPPFSVIAVSSQILYGALILTFVGGLHWGILLVAGSLFSQRQIVARLVWSVVPSLYAFWFAQTTEPGPLLYLAGGLCVALAVDLYFYSGTPIPGLKAFLPLRFILTVVAGVCLLVTWFAAIR
ncbi:MAG: DUF3429 domain-containing protein [Burkholderiaceae bacterium]